MLRRVAATLIIAFCVVSAVNALSVNSYRDEKNDELRKINKAYLAGVRDGIVTVNHAIALEEMAAGVFCAGDGVSFCLSCDSRDLTRCSMASIFFRRT
jgi:hypothetical protein